MKDYEFYVEIVIALPKTEVSWSMSIFLFIIDLMFACMNWFLGSNPTKCWILARLECEKSVQIVLHGCCFSTQLDVGTGA
jgi:hypothetical protein